MKINAQLGALQFAPDGEQSFVIFQSWEVDIEDEEGIYLSAMVEELRMQGANPYLEAGTALRVVEGREAV